MITINKELTGYKVYAILYSFINLLIAFFGLYLDNFRFDYNCLMISFCVLSIIFAFFCNENTSIYALILLFISFLFEIIQILLYLMPATILLKNLYTYNLQSSLNLVLFGSLFNGSFFSKHSILQTFLSYGVILITPILFNIPLIYTNLKITKK